MIDGQGSEKLSALRESLRRLDAVLNFARKLARDTGTVPPGLMTDFFEARKDVEKHFVIAFDDVEDKLQKQLRDLLTATKSLTDKKVAAHCDRISQRVRSALNHLVIHGDGGPSLTAELVDVRFNDDDPVPLPPPTPAAAYAFPAAAPVSAPVRTDRPQRRPRRALLAVVAIGVVGMLALAAGVLAWPRPAPLDNSGPIADNRAPANRPRTNAPEPEPETPFDAAAAGYTLRLTAVPISHWTNPLEATPDGLSPDQLASVMLGLEELIGSLEPGRLAFAPAETNRRLGRFAETAAASQDTWIEQRQPLLDALAAHIRKEQQLALYPGDSSSGNVLISDVLYAGGGGQFALVVTMQSLAQACEAPTRLITPTGLERPLLAVETKAGMATFNGETFGLRPSNQPAALLKSLLTEVALRLRRTMETPEGRLLCSALTLHLTGALDGGQAAAALADLDPAWLATPDDDSPRAALVHEIARRVQPAVCAVLLGAAASGNADEALALYRVAVAAGDTTHADLALLALGKRAAKGAMLDGQPLPLVVGDLLRAQKRVAEAATWYQRAMDEHPDDTRPVLRLLDQSAGQSRLGLSREAYQRGERSAPFMRGFARAAAEGEDNLLALKLLDELIAGGNFDALDLENAAVTCIALGRADWALERLAAHRDVVAGEPGLQRLDLICELSANGWSPRAQSLAAAWRTRGEGDEFVEGLLRRYGG